MLITVFSFKTGVRSERQPTKNAQRVLKIQEILSGKKENFEVPKMPLLDD